MRLTRSCGAARVRPVRPFAGGTSTQRAMHWRCVRVDHLRMRCGQACANMRAVTPRRRHSVTDLSATRTSTTALRRQEAPRFSWSARDTASRDLADEMHKVVALVEKNKTVFVHRHRTSHKSAVAATNPPISLQRSMASVEQTFGARMLAFV